MKKEKQDVSCNLVQLVFNNFIFELSYFRKLKKLFLLMKFVEKIQIFQANISNSDVFETS